jgi:hypothetical protein
MRTPGFIFTLTSLVVAGIVGGALFDEPAGARAHGGAAPALQSRLERALCKEELRSGEPATARVYRLPPLIVAGELSEGFLNRAGSSGLDRLGDVSCEKVRFTGRLAGPGSELGFAEYMVNEISDVIFEPARARNITDTEYVTDWFRVRAVDDAKIEGWIQCGRCQFTDGVQQLQAVDAETPPATSTLGDLIWRRTLPNRKKFERGRDPSVGDPCSRPGSSSARSADTRYFVVNNGPEPTPAGFSISLLFADNSAIRARSVDVEDTDLVSGIAETPDRTGRVRVQLVRSMSPGERVELDFALLRAIFRRYERSEFPRAFQSNRAFQSAEVDPDNEVVETDEENNGVEGGPVLQSGDPGLICLPG